MDAGDILTYVICFAVGIFGFVLQLKKKARERAAEEPIGVPFDEEDADVQTDEICGGFIPEAPRPTVKPTRAPRTAQTGRAASRPAPATPQPTTETEPDYGIHTAEEARQAVIWSEILRRKY